MGANLVNFHLTCLSDLSHIPLKFLIYPTSSQRPLGPCHVLCKNILNPIEHVAPQKFPLKVPLKTMTRIWSSRNPLKFLLIYPLKEIGKNLDLL